jgi:hypothetical protein
MLRILRQVHWCRKVLKNVYYHQRGKDDEKITLSDASPKTNIPWWGNNVKHVIRINIIYGFGAISIMTSAGFIVRRLWVMSSTTTRSYAVSTSLLRCEVIITDAAKRAPALLCRLLSPTHDEEARRAIRSTTVTTDLTIMAPSITVTKQQAKRALHRLMRKSDTTLIAFPRQ